MSSLASGTDVLYLDFDGVLHPEDVWVSPKRGAYVRTPPGHELFEHATLLQRLLEPYPSLRIVVSSSWQIRYGYTGAIGRLPTGLRNRCIGGTFHRRHMRADAFQASARGEQVLNDVRRHHPLRWLALDDSDEGWPLLERGNVFICDPVNGISDAKSLGLLVQRLNRFQGPSHLTRIP